MNNSGGGTIPTFFSKEIPQTFWSLWGITEYIANTMNIGNDLLFPALTLFLEEKRNGIVKPTVRCRMKWKNWGLGELLIDSETQSGCEAMRLV